ncbi:MAG: acyl-CoA dehydrogenase family protein [Acidimicrobiales bacterium]
MPIADHRARARFHPASVRSGRVDFELTDEQQAFRKVVREFAEAEIAPPAEEWDTPLGRCFAGARAARDWSRISASCMTATTTSTTSWPPRPGAIPP